MASEYILVCEWGGGCKSEHEVHDGTQAETLEKARFVVKLVQDRLVTEHDDDTRGTPVVKGTLYHRIAEIDGVEFFGKVLPEKIQAPIVLHYKCYACNYIGSEPDFKGPRGYECPKCTSEDVFPERWYRCKKCGKVQDQNEWFGEETSLDEDPLETKEEAVPCESCVKKYEHSQIGVTTDETLDEYWERMKELQKTPAELEEVQVEVGIALPKSDLESHELESSDD